MSEPAAPFAVWQFFTGGSCVKELEGLTAWGAVAAVHRLTLTLGAQTGSTCRIIVTDANDFTVLEWRHGEGLVFIKPEV